MSALREPGLAREASSSVQFSPFAQGKIPTVEELLGPLYTPEYREAFPDVQPPYQPFGYLALIQLRMPRKKIGRILVPETETDVERYRTQASLVRGLGWSCFKDRQTGTDWVEGPWFKLGDFVRSPLFGGDRFDIEFKTADGKLDKVTFVFVKESDMVALVTGNPLNIQTS